MTPGKLKGQAKPRLGLTLSGVRTRRLVHIGVLKAFNESCIHLSCLADAAGVESLVPVLRSTIKCSFHQK